VELVEYDTAGLQHVDLVVLYQALVVISIAIEQLLKVIIFCAFLMLVLIHARPMQKVSGSVAVPPL